MTTPYHTRSNSLPSRSTPVVSQFDEQLNRLRSSESASSSSSSSTSSTITSKLTLLSGLYNCIDELLQISSSQKVFGREKLVEDALEGSIKLLDMCNIISDVLSQMKERAQDLQSILRRRCSKDEIAKEVAKYLRSRKMAVKVVSRALKELKKTESDEITDDATTSRLRECQMVALNVLESILVAIAGAKARSSWDTVVSKLLKSKRLVTQQETQLFLVEFEAADASLHPEQVRSELEKMEITIKNVEQGVEILFRHLIKTRSTILNILNC